MCEMKSWLPAFRILILTNQEDGSENRCEEECTVREEEIVKEEELKFDYYIFTESCFSFGLYPWHFQIDAHIVSSITNYGMHYSGFLLLGYFLLI